MTTMIRSTIVGSLALLTLFACERDNAQQQPGGATDDTSGMAPANRDDDTLGTGTAAERRGTGSPAAGDDIERTGGRDVPMGMGGTAGRASGAVTAGSGGRGGAGGTAGAGAGTTP